MRSKKISEPRKRARVLVRRQVAAALGERHLGPVVAQVLEDGGQAPRTEPLSGSAGSTNVSDTRSGSTTSRNVPENGSSTLSGP